MLEPFKNINSRLLFSENNKKLYHILISPNIKWLLFLIILIIIDVILLNYNFNNWFVKIEFLLGLIIGTIMSIIGIKICQDYFEKYLLEEILKDKININTKLLNLGNFLSKATLILIIIFVFAQTHQINLIGLIASLGIVGAVIIFASQKILEQILWSIIIYVDSPFKVGDYIYLPDQTLGKVEEIGWRSTKIRLSEKNILAIIPNSNLAQVKIENLSQTKRCILLVEITFLTSISDEEKALINQLILQETRDIVGIDHQMTQVKFYGFNNSDEETLVRAEIIFYVLGTAEISMELRTSLLEIVRNNIVKSLNNNGINFEVNNKILEITQPINM